MMPWLKKRDGHGGMCVDYRALNQATIKKKFPISIIEELLDELGSSSIFSKINLWSIYWNIHMDSNDFHKFTSHTHKHPFKIPTTHESCIFSLLAQIYSHVL